jgi:hypothetical protein
MQAGVFVACCVSGHCLTADDTLLGAFVAAFGSDEQAVVGKEGLGDELL